jgi:hypothetical protein
MSIRHSVVINITSDTDSDGLGPLVKKRREAHDSNTDDSWDSDDDVLGDFELNTSHKEECGKEKFCNGCPVYKWTARNEHFSLRELVDILLLKNVPASSICSAQPSRVKKNVSFVVDLHQLNNPRDIRADENGVWLRKGAPVAYISLQQKDGEISVHKVNSMSSVSTSFKIVRSYYRHSASPDFSRTIAMAYDHCGILQQLAFVQYSFDREEHIVHIDPHGNSIKSKKPLFLLSQHSH